MQLTISLVVQAKIAIIAVALIALVGSASAGEHKRLTNV